MSYRFEPPPVRSNKEQQDFRNAVIGYQQRYFEADALFCALTLQGLSINRRRINPYLNPSHIHAHHIKPWSWSVNLPTPIPRELINSHQNGIMVWSTIHDVIHNVAKTELLVIAKKKQIEIQKVDGKEDFRPIGIDCVSTATAVMVRDNYAQTLLAALGNESLRAYLSKPVSGGSRLVTDEDARSEVWQDWKHHAGIYVLEQFYIDHGIMPGHNYDQYGLVIEGGSHGLPDIKRKGDNSTFYRGTTYSTPTNIPTVGSQPTHRVSRPEIDAHLFYNQGTVGYEISARAGEELVPIAA